MSKNAKSKKSADVSANYDGAYAPKIRFPLYIYPETMKRLRVSTSRIIAAQKLSSWRRRYASTAHTLCRTSLSSSNILRRR